MKYNNNIAPAADIEQRIAERFQQILDRYDFSHFTLPSFIAWVEEEQGKPIQTEAWSMPATIFGAWLSGAEMDHIFYDEDAIPLHQVHIQLHELAHILCGHQTLTASEDILADILQGKFDAADLLLRSAKSDEQEQEAELLSALIQEQVRRHIHFEELTKAVISDDEQHKLYIALGLLE